jgi:hypothetical protein
MVSIINLMSMFEDIKATHAEYTFALAPLYGEFKVILMKENSYINVTKLCQLGNKKFHKWSRLDGSKNLIEVFSKNLNIDKLLIEVKGGSNQTVTGTYAHPDLVPHIASWVSTKFAILISTIIKEWRNIHPTNEHKYWNDMGDAIINHPNPTTEQEESTIRDNIAKDENGRTEVEVATGVIDVKTDTKIIEVKTASNWKHAVGQVLVYSLSVPRYYEKWIYLYGDCTCRDLIVKYCSQLDVNVKFVEQ